jgi:hypothetical protein
VLTGAAAAPPQILDCEFAGQFEMIRQQ